MAALPGDVENVFVIGGAQLYQEALNHPLCQKLHVTHLKGDFNCDTFFPPISQRFFPVCASEEFMTAGLTYQFCEYLSNV